jgi:hypothetical protein
METYIRKGPARTPGALLGDEPRAPERDERSRRYSVELREELGIGLFEVEAGLAVQARPECPISVKRYIIADLARFPDDGNRYKLLDGVLIVTPAPSNAHQIIVNRRQFRRAVDAHTLQTATQHTDDCQRSATACYVAACRSPGRELRWRFARSMRDASHACSRNPPAVHSLEWRTGRCRAGAGGRARRVGPTLGTRVRC